MTSAAAEFGFILNGRLVRVSGEAPQTSLLDYVRNAGLTGAKEGCAEGECGACAVLLVSPRGNGSSVYQSINSCLTPLPSVAGREVFTVEGLAKSGRLAEVQQAMVEHNGSQCGYCTPGFVVSMFAEQYRPGRGAPDVHALGGNLCRCTGYRPIRDAMLSVGPPSEGEFLSRLDHAAPELTALEYAAVGGRFSRPVSLWECLRLAADHPDSRFIAGNTDLGVVTNLRGERFSHLIALEAVAELMEFRESEDSVEIGAGLSLTEIDDRWHDSPRVFREWLPLFASILIRNRATLGGNLATASPIGDAAPMLLALDAQVRIASLRGERILPLSEFFQGYRRTLLGQGELLRSVLIPKPFPQAARFYKVAKRSLDDISTVAACFAVSRDEAGRIGTARLAFGGVAAVPLRAIDAEQALTGSFGSKDDVTRAKQAIRGAMQPIGDHRGSAEYRMALTHSLLDKFWFEQFEAESL
jgi:xanthine dehydrogenase small subunit